jgi:hypothetical protein
MILKITWQNGDKQKIKIPNDFQFPKKINFKDWAVGFFIEEGRCFRVFNLNYSREVEIVAE